MTNPIPDAALAQHTIVLDGFGRTSPTIVPSEMDRAYAAGFFDGEGNVCIARNLRGGQERTHYVHNMRVGASQREAATLFWLRDRWGGSVRPSQRKTPSGVRTYYVWGCFAIGAAAFLRDVLPYLQVKRERAELALEFQATSFQPGRRAHTPERNDQRAAMKVRMNHLNGKPAIA